MFRPKIQLASVAFLAYTDNVVCQRLLCVSFDTAQGLSALAQLATPFRTSINKNLDNAASWRIHMLRRFNGCLAICELIG